MNKTVEQLVQYQENLVRGQLHTKDSWADECTKEILKVLKLHIPVKPGQRKVLRASNEIFPGSNYSVIKKTCGKCGVVVEDDWFVCPYCEAKIGR